jgi:hypothetical protein
MTTYKSLIHTVWNKWIDLLKKDDSGFLKNTIQEYGGILVKIIENTMIKILLNF